MAVKTVQAIINGVTTTLTLNSATGKYEATITAPPKSSYPLDNHYYPVTVKATDEAGNVTTVDPSHATLGNSLKLFVKEKTAPTLTWTYPGANALITNNKPKFEWTVTDDDSGVNPDTIGITIDSNSKVTSGITKTPITNGYKCTYTPTNALGEGSHTVKIDATDYDGNAATQKSVTFKVDTVPPTLNVTTPADGTITNKSTITVSGTTNDATSSPVTLTINGQSVTVASNGTFSKEVTLSEGPNPIVVKATDSAGKYTTITRNVVLDTAKPEIVSVTMTPNPVDGGKTFIISVEASDA